MVDNNIYFSEAYTDDTPWVFLSRLLSKFASKIKKIYNLFFRKAIVYTNKIRINFYRKYKDLINPLALKYQEVDNFTTDGVSVSECAKRAKDILFHVVLVAEDYINDANDDITVQEFCTEVLTRTSNDCAQSKSIYQNVKVVLLTDDEDDKFLISPKMWRDLSDDDSDTIMKWCEKDITTAQKIAIKYLKTARKGTRFLKDRVIANRVIRILTTAINSIYRLTDEIFRTVMVSLHYQYESFKKALKLSIKYARKAVII